MSKQDRAMRRSYHKTLKNLGVPWHYRCRFTNWLMAKPWQLLAFRQIGWNYPGIYRSCRAPEYVKNLDSGVYEPVPGTEKVGPIRAAWRAFTFPHVHHYLED